VVVIVVGKSEGGVYFGGDVVPEFAVAAYNEDFGEGF